MKDIIVLSKKNFIETMKQNNITNDNVETFKNLYIISIEGSFKTEHYFKTNKSNVLNLIFDDIAVDEYNKILFSDEHAKQIIKFVENISKENFQIIIHCAAGISRSGAVGSFLQYYFDTDYEKFKSTNIKISPNYHVLSVLKKVLKIF